MVPYKFIHSAFFTIGIFHTTQIQRSHRRSPANNKNPIRSTSNMYHSQSKYSNACNVSGFSLLATRDIINTSIITSIHVKVSGCLANIHTCNFSHFAARAASLFSLSSFCAHEQLIVDQRCIAPYDARLSRTHKQFIPSVLRMQTIHTSHMQVIHTVKSTVISFSLSLSQLCICE